MIFYDIVDFFSPSVNLFDIDRDKYTDSRIEIGIVCTVFVSRQRPFCGIQQSRYDRQGFRRNPVEFREQPPNFALANPVQKSTERLMVQPVGAVHDFAQIAQHFSHIQGRFGFPGSGWTCEK